MSVGGDQFGNLDNFRKTSLSGPDATRRFGRGMSSDLDREARKLRRQGYGAQAAELAGAASMQRVNDIQRFGTNLVSGDRRQAAYAADTQAMNEANDQRKALMGAFVNALSGNRRPSGPSGGSSVPQSVTKPATQPTTQPAAPTTATEPSKTGFTSTLAKQAQNAWNNPSDNAADNSWKRGMDTALKRAVSSGDTNAVNELRQVALGTGTITGEQFDKRMGIHQDYAKRRPALSRLLSR